MSKKRVNQPELTRSELFKTVRKQLSRQKIINYDEIPTSHLYKPHLETLTNLILRTITTGESNSLFIAGPRGSGKTTLLNSALNSMKIGKKNLENQISIVELNGIIHTDDNIALKDIARQLNLNNVVEEKVTGTFAENMALILETLKLNDNTEHNQTLIFSIEEFDLFSRHKNQTLLYNLFDSAQNSGMPILVFGITCRLDVVELLEKRVKSRFSHRQLYLFDNITFDEYIETAKYWLLLGNNVPDSSLKTKWNKFVNYCFFQDENMRTILKRNYDFSPNFSSLQKKLWPIIGELSFSLKLPQNAKDIAIPESFFLKPILNDSKQLLIQSLSILELTLIIVMLRHATIYEGEPFNLRTIYEQYKKLIQSDKNEGLTGMREFPKAVVSKAFENMEHLELIRPADNSSVLTSYKGQKDYRLLHLLLQPSQLKEALKNYPSLPAQLNQFASNSF